MAEWRGESWLINEAGTNVIGLIDIEDEDSAVTDLAGSGCLGDHFNDVIHPAIVGDNLDHRFGEQRYLVLQTTIKSGLSLLMPVPPNVGNGKARCHALDPLDEIVELLRPDDALDQFHVVILKRNGHKKAQKSQNYFRVLGFVPFCGYSIFTLVSLRAPS